MKRKKRSSRGKRSQTRIEAPPAFSLLTIEKELARVGRIAYDREFDSEEEMGAFIQAAFGDKTPRPERPSTPLEQAQDLMYDAWEAPTRERGLGLARKALALSQDCADAYAFLAEDEDVTVEEACELYAQGMAAGHRALGVEFFRTHTGDFWGFVETRPYMRARCGLAQCLWDLGENEQAVEHYRAMLELNPNDNQGVRYLLLACLLDLDRDVDSQRLLDAFPDDGSAAWPYARALLAFRGEGDTEQARAGLTEAINLNPHVPYYLLRRVMVSDPVPNFLSIGEESEALVYASEYREPWRRTTGALTWLKQVLATAGLPS